MDYLTTIEDLKRENAGLRQALAEMTKAATPIFTTVQHEAGCFDKPRTARGCACGQDHQ